MKTGWPGRWAALLAAAMVVASGPARSAPATVMGVYEYEVEVIANGQPPNKMSQKVWVKGPRSRREIATPQGKQVILTGPDGTIRLIPGKNEAMKMPMPPGGKANPNSSLFPDLAKVKQMKKVGTERIGVYMTEIHESTTAINQKGMPPGEVATRFWITDRLAVPVKIMNKLPVMTMTMTLKSAQPNAPVPDSMFAVPKGTKIMDMPMPKARPFAPKGK